MSENLPAGCTDHHVNEHFGSAWNRWFEQNEDSLLEDFIETLTMSNNRAFVVVPAVKEWNAEQTKAWEAFVDRAWEAEQP